MNLLGIPLSTGAWLAPMTALAAMAVAVAVVLLRDHLRLERHAAALEAEVARLQGDVQQLRAGARARRGEAFRAAGARGIGTLERSFRAPLGGIAGLATLLLDTSPRWRAGDPCAADQGPRRRPDRRIEPARLPPARRRHALLLQARKVIRVLLAEDDEINGLFAARSLETADVAIDWVRDGEEALRRIEASFSGASPAYDVVLMDLRMPGLDGLGAARRIRALEASLGRSEPLRIVAVTAATMRQDRLAAEKAGISDFLAKPYGTHDLIRRLAPRKRSSTARRSGRQQVRSRVSHNRRGSMLRSRRRPDA